MQIILRRAIGCCSHCSPLIRSTASEQHTACSTPHRTTPHHTTLAFKAGIPEKAKSHPSLKSEYAAATLVQANQSSISTVCFRAVRQGRDSVALRHFLFDHPYGTSCLIAVCVRPPVTDREGSMQQQQAAVVPRLGICSDRPYRLHSDRRPSDPRPIRVGTA